MVFNFEYNRFELYLASQSEEIAGVICPQIYIIYIM